MPKLPKSVAALAGVLALTGCAPAEEDAPPTPSPSAMDETPAPAAVTGDEKGGDSEGPRPMLEHSAWRSAGEDGATYATFLDGEGRYRDMRNGEPRQEGSWEVREDGAVCFLPDGDNVRGDCWNLGRLRKNGSLVATGQDGQRIELHQIDYQAPEEDS